MHKLNQRLRHWCEYIVFRTLVCLVEALSPRMCARLSHFGAVVVHYWLPRRWTRYHIARDNLRGAFGGKYNDRQIDDLIFRMWVHLFRMVGEIVQLPRKLRLDNVVDAIEFRGKRGVVQALNSGRPLILLSGHFGNWEMAISVFGLFGFPMGLVARELDNPLLERWFRRFRRGTGHWMIPKRGGGEQMVNTLDSHGKLAMLGDQDAGSTGLFVNFFGRPASTHKSIALIALEYKALICVGSARRLENETLPNGWPRYELGCEEIIDCAEIESADAIREVTQRCATALERVVRRSPEQYFWVHRRWKSIPRSRAERRRKAG
jgi:Kdo2-lipid IVA lauroyltransferase/acyltransferase